MTNKQFTAWRIARFPSQRACAQALNMNYDTVQSLEDGVSRKGNPYPVPMMMALACAAWDLNVRDHDGKHLILATPAQPK